MSQNSSNEHQSAPTAAPEPTPENELNGGCHARLVRCSSFSLWEWVKDTWCGGPDEPVHKVMKFFICMGLFNIVAGVALVIIKLCKYQ